MYYKKSESNSNYFEFYGLADAKAANQIRPIRGPSHPR